MVMRARFVKQMALWGIVVTLAAAACGGSGARETLTRTPVAAETPQPAAGGNLRLLLASSDIAVGRNRVAFGLVDDEAGPLRNAGDVQVSTFFLTNEGREGPIERVGAVFRKWPSGAGGVYTTNLNFDRPGNWGIGVAVTQAEGPARTGSARVSVLEASRTPALGALAPRSRSKTSRDVTGLEQLTTDAQPDRALYEMTIAEALDSGIPLVVTFATPAYCTTATCGPQLEVIKESKSRHHGKANYIHVEVYDNPQDIQGDLSNAKLSPTLVEWGLPSDPWTFVIDAEGLVFAKFEGFATPEELEEAVLEVLR